MTLLIHARDQNSVVLCFLHNQDEEEVPSESGKDGKDEEGKEEVQKEEAAKEKQEDSEKSEGEEKSQEKTEETGSKTDAKVRSGTHSLRS